MIENNSQKVMANKNHWATQIIDRADRGMIPKKYCGNRAFVIGNYLVQRQKYLTNRMAEIVAWDVYRSTDLKNIVNTFKAKKAAVAFIDSMLQLELDI